MSEGKMLTTMGGKYEVYMEERKGTPFKRLFNACYYDMAGNEERSFFDDNLEFDDLIRILKEYGTIDNSAETEFRRWAYPT